MHSTKLKYNYMYRIVLRVRELYKDFLHSDSTNNTLDPLCTYSWSLLTFFGSRLRSYFSFSYIKK
jgi:hypothetical protein